VSNDLSFKMHYSSESTMEDIPPERILLLTQLISNARDLVGPDALPSSILLDNDITIVNAAITIDDLYFNLPILDQFKEQNICGLLIHESSHYKNKDPDFFAGLRHILSFTSNINSMKNVYDEDQEYFTGLILKRYKKIDNFTNSLKTLDGHFQYLGSFFDDFGIDLDNLSAAEITEIFLENEHARSGMKNLANNVTSNPRNDTKYTAPDSSISITTFLGEKKSDRLRLDKLQIRDYEDYTLHLPQDPTEKQNCLQKIKDCYNTFIVPLSKQHEKFIIYNTKLRHSTEYLADTLMAQETGLENAVSVLHRLAELSKSENPYYVEDEDHPSLQDRITFIQKQAAKKSIPVQKPTVKSTMKL
jgi:hypothetical protein